MYKPVAKAMNRVKERKFVVRRRGANAPGGPAVHLMASDPGHAVADRNDCLLCAGPGPLSFLRRTRPPSRCPALVARQSPVVGGARFHESLRTGRGAFRPG